MGDKLRSQSCSFDLFIASRTPGIEKFNAYSLAKAHNFLREMMKKILWEVYTELWRFRIFVIDSKIHQTLNFYLKRTKTNRPAKVTLVLSGKFIESSTTLLKQARLHKCSSKYAQQTCFNESKLSLCIRVYMPFKHICTKVTTT